MFVLYVNGMDGLDEGADIIKELFQKHYQANVLIMDCYTTPDMRSYHILDAIRTYTTIRDDVVIWLHVHGVKKDTGLKLQITRHVLLDPAVLNYSISTNLCKSLTIVFNCCHSGLCGQPQLPVVVSARKNNYFSNCHFQHPRSFSQKLVTDNTTFLGYDPPIYIRKNIKIVTQTSAEEEGIQLKTNGPRFLSLLAIAFKNVFGGETVVRGSFFDEDNLREVQRELELLTLQHDISERSIYNLQCSYLK